VPAPIEMPGAATGTVGDAISSFFGCIKSSLSRLPGTGCLAVVLHQKHGEVRGERFGRKLPHH
jgi:hypothetical protein